MTNITAKQHDELTKLIYNNYDLLEVIYKQIIMKIPDQVIEAAQPEPSKKKVKKTAPAPAYQPSCEEIKLGARAFASMPFAIMKGKNLPLNLEGIYYDYSVSVSGYFKALTKIIEKGYGNPEAKQIENLIALKERQPEES